MRREVTAKCVDNISKAGCGTLGFALQLQNPNPSPGRHPPTTLSLWERVDAPGFCALFLKHKRCDAFLLP